MMMYLPCDEGIRNNSLGECMDECEAMHLHEVQWVRVLVLVAGSSLDIDCGFESQ